MFSAVEIAWFSIIPATIAVMIVWLANRQSPVDDGGLDDSSDVTRRPIRMVGLAFTVAVSFAMFGIQTHDHHRVLVALRGDAGSTTDSRATTSGSLWAQATSKTVADYAKPKVAHHWAILIAIVGLLAGYFVGSGFPAIPGLLAAWAVVAAMVLRLLWSSIYLRSEWTRMEQVAWIGGGSLLAGWAWWMAANRISNSNRAGKDEPAIRDSHAHQRLFLIGGTICLMAATLLFTGSLRYGVAAAVVASAAGGCWIAGWRLRHNGMTGEWCGPVMLLAMYLLIIGTAFSELPVAQALLFAASLLFALVARSCNGDSPIWKRLGWTAIGIAPAIVATVWAVIIFADTINNTPVNPYDAYK